VLRALGNTTSKRVIPTVGAEQEYFLVDKDSFDQRSDLLLTGRTVFGVLPAKGQEMEDHYYGAIDERVADFMREVNYELWKVGVPAKTQHNEVAPNSFELAVVYQNASQAVDSNQLVMETLHKVAKRHGLEALLNEKPFDGVNGSGKHHNWSLSTDDGINIFDPGSNPAANPRFLLFAAAVVEAVDRYALLIRAAAACAGNDYRLGGNEAPPAIVSIFFGAELSEILDSFVEGKTADCNASGRGRLRMDTGVASLPSFPRDVSDRNRTSPFAFTGNKFEFRMVGSSQSVATPNSYINTTVAEVLSGFADKLEAAADKNAAVRDIIKESYSKHRRIVFNGNGYSDEWLREAERRGLPNVRSNVAALSALKDETVIALFEKHHVMSREEQMSRYYAYLENYSKQVNIEAGVMIKMARRASFPAMSAYSASLAQEAASLDAINAVSVPQGQLAKKIAGLNMDLYNEINAFSSVLQEAQNAGDSFAQAKAYSEKVRPAMAALREKADALERLSERSIWPFPGYEELLFKL
jgi:glutamine synthetase